MDIVILADFCGRFDETDNSRFLYLANMLKDNHQVEVITSDFNHGTKSYFEKVPDGYPYKITMLHEGVYKKNVCLQRFKSHYLWGKNVIEYLKKRKKPDVIYCAIPPLRGPYEAAKYCKKNGIRFIIDVQDLWPEAFRMVFNLPVISSCIFAPFDFLANRTYKMADEIIAVSQTYANRALQVNSKCQKGNVVFLGTNIDKFDYAAKNAKVTIEKNQSEIWIGYCGTLGHSYNITIILEALKNIKSKGITNFKFIVMGTGPLENKFKELAEKWDLPAVFTGKLPYDEMCAQLKLCDIAVNPISKGSSGSIINKHGDYAMAGLPVVNTQESKEYRELIDEYNCGINCGVESLEEVTQAIEKLMADEALRLEMGKNSRKLGEEKFNRKQSYTKIVEIIETVS